MNTPHRSTPQAWRSHPAYQRFWNHYDDVMGFCRSYLDSVRNRPNSLVPPPARFPSPTSRFRHPHHPHHPCSHVVRHPTRQPRHPSHPVPKRCSLKRSRVVTPDIEEHEGDDLHMEINDDMAEFFQKSQKHREEREAKKVAKAEEKEVRVDITASVHVLKARISEEAPKERPGVKRTFEMKQLYGLNAAKIHGMETAMQLTFDRNCDRAQPKVWPIMPFKIKFS